MKPKTIRLATAEDAAGILQVYAPYITDTTITFECKIPSEEEFRSRVKSTLQKYPWLVCETDGHIIGYAYAAAFNEREAYNWSVTCSVYVDPRYHRQKIGQALYTALFELLKLQGFYNVYAIVTVPNVKSESLHEAFGFEAIGVFARIGFKFDHWLDIKWYGLKLNQQPDSPQPPKPIGEIAATDQFRQVLKKAEQMI